MLFNSYLFLFLFLPLALIVYFLLSHFKLPKLAILWLIFSSLFFYAYWRPVFLFLLLGSIILNYLLARRLSAPSAQNKKAWLAFSITVNLGLLAYFKYSNFFIDNLNLFLNKHIGHLNIILPLAISFFTFQQIAYIVDSYKGKVNEHSFKNYLLFISFFPQLISGPIVHHSEMMPQFAQKNIHQPNYRNLSIGIFLIAIGLFKKVVIADNFAIWANSGFDISSSLSFVQAWIVSLSYTFQLYFDFSGYTDMALGAAQMFNIRLPINFNSPYKALNIQDFWRRWHITLSRFLKEYLYIPLGGNRQRLLGLLSSLVIVFVLGGLWHGAAWTFIVWGALHGFAMVVFLLWKKFGKIKLNKFFAWFLTFQFVNLAWVFFRAESFSRAIDIVKGMFALNSVKLPLVFQTLFGQLNTKIQFGNFLIENLQVSGALPHFALFLILVSTVVIFAPNSNQISQKLKPNPFYFSFTLILLLVSIYFMGPNSQFIYFNF